MPKKKSITADELMNRLEADPEWVARRTARDARRAERECRLAADEASVIADLAAAGAFVSSVYDFVNGGPAPDIALPVLVRHLGVAHQDRIREGIIRALGIPSARGIAFEPLRDAFRNERDPTLR